MLFAFLCGIQLLVMYVAYMKSKLKKVISENFNLFDKMHEGLLVLSKQDRSLMLVSKPAIRLLKPSKAKDNSDLKEKIEEYDLDNPIFEEAYIKVKNGDNAS